MGFKSSNAAGTLPAALSRPVKVVQIVLICGSLLLWELASWLGWLDSRLLPPPTRIVPEIFFLLSTPSFLYDLWITIVEIGVAFVCVVIIGMPLGFYLGETAGRRNAAQPVLQFMIAMPKAIMLPLFILAFGIGFLERTTFAFTVGLFVSMLNGIVAAQSVPSGLVTASRSFGASTRQIYYHIYMPAMMPQIIAGIRLCLVFVIFGVILAQMYASSSGIGRLIFSWGETSRINLLIAGIVIITFLAVLPNEMLRLLEAFIRKRRGETA